MLQVIIPSMEFFDDEKQEFKNSIGATLQLEHSLLSLSKWESKWCKPFLGKDEDKTSEETIDYIRCMTINANNISPDVYDNIPDDIFKQITDYIRAPMTATWFNEPEGTTKKREIMTAEIFYYCMIAYNIPMECQKWHLNRLITLIRVCKIKNEPPKKRGRKESIAERNALNEARKKQFNTKG